MADVNTVEHLSVAMTTDTASDVTQTITGMTSSSSRGMEFYFQCAVVVIGVVGTAANALILYGLVASKQHKKLVLIVNQNVLDFISSLLLVVTYALKLCNFYLTGVGGYWFCMLLLSEGLLWCVINASKVNLMIVTIERYLKVVYATWSKNKLRKWKIYTAMAFAWLIGFVCSFAVSFPTSDVIDGVCYGYCDLAKSTRTDGLRYLVFRGFLSHYNCDRHPLLLAYSGRHSSSGKRDGRPRWRWIKHRSSDPVS